MRTWPILGVLMVVGLGLVRPALGHEWKDADGRSVVTSGSGGCARRLIEIQLRSVIERPSGEGDRRGCLTVNCAVELAPHDPTVHTAVSNHLDRMEELFHRLIAQGQEEGGISRRHDARSLARYLVNALCGLQVMAKADRNCQTLDDVVTTILAALD